jgi:hypothetical protein
MFCPAFSLAELTATFLSRVQMSRVDPSTPLALYPQAVFLKVATRPLRNCFHTTTERLKDAQGFATPRFGGVAW